MRKGCLNPPPRGRAGNVDMHRIRRRIQPDGGEPRKLIFSAAPAASPWYWRRNQFAVPGGLFPSIRHRPDDRRTISSEPLRTSKRISGTRARVVEIMTRARMKQSAIRAAAIANRTASNRLSLMQPSSTPAQNTGARRAPQPEWLRAGHAFTRIARLRRRPGRNVA